MKDSSSIPNNERNLFSSTNSSVASETPSPQFFGTPYFHLSAMLVASTNLMRDGFEIEMDHTLYENPIEMELFTGKKLLYQAFSTIDKAKPGNFYYDDVCNSDLSDYGFDINNLKCISEYYGYEPDEKKEESYSVSSLRRTVEDDRFIHFQQTLLCPYVTFNFTDKDVNISISKSSLRPWDFKISIRFTKTTTFEISGIKELNQIRLNGILSLDVCLELVEEKMALFIQQLGTSNDMSVMDLIQHVEAISLTAVSIVCLAFTLVTYCLSRSLRTEAGINNMCLCGSLAMAQTFLLMVTYIE